MPLGELAYLLLGGVLSRGEEVLLVVRKLAEVLDLLLAVEHLPALLAEDFAVGLGLDQVEPLDQLPPLERSPLQQLPWPLLLAPLGPAPWFLGVPSVHGFDDCLFDVWRF